jgi:hypothetical protein
MSPRPWLYPPAHLTLEVKPSFLPEQSLTRETDKRWTGGLTQTCLLGSNFMCFLVSTDPHAAEAVAVH